MTTSFTPPPGYITVEEAVQRDLITHEEAWRLVAPECDIPPAPSILFWCLSNKQPIVLFPNGSIAHVIPRDQLGEIFPNWVIKQAVQAKIKAHRNMIYVLTLDKAKLFETIKRHDLCISANKEAISFLKARARELV